MIDIISMYYNNLLLCGVQKSIMTATTTRRKQQQELVHRALLAEEERRRAARHNFHVTSMPVTQLAAYEPALHHAATADEHDDGRRGRGGGL